MKLLWISDNGQLRAYEDGVDLLIVSSSLMATRSHRMAPHEVANLKRALGMESAGEWSAQGQLDRLDAWLRDNAPGAVMEGGPVTSAIRLLSGLQALVVTFHAPVMSIVSEAISAARKLGLLPPDQPRTIRVTPGDVEAGRVFNTEIKVTGDEPLACVVCHQLSSHCDADGCGGRRSPGWRTAKRQRLGSDHGSSRS